MANNTKTHISCQQTNGCAYKPKQNITALFTYSIVPDLDMSLNCPKILYKG